MSSTSLKIKKKKKKRKSCSKLNQNANAYNLHTYRKCMHKKIGYETILNIQMKITCMKIFKTKIN